MGSFHLWKVDISTQKLTKNTHKKEVLLFGQTKYSKSKDLCFAFTVMFPQNELQSKQHDFGVIKKNKIVSNVM